MSRSSVKDLESFMEKLGIHVSTKSMSEMESLLDKQSAHIKQLASLDQSKTVIVTGIVNKSVVTIYGEIHSDIDNRFYEKLKLKGHTVFVEHSTNHRELKPIEHALFADAKGSEWVWFTRTRNKHEVICVDTRLENGFLSGYEEQNLHTMPLKDLLDSATRVMRTANALKEKYSQIQPVFANIMATIKRQYLMLMKLNGSAASHIRVNDESVPKNLIFDASRRFLISNMIKVASLSVDMHIIDLLSQHKGGAPISIFVGINHALRLASFLKLYIVTDDELIEPYLRGANVFSDGDEESEKTIIAQI